MGQHDAENITFKLGDAKTFPHSLAAEHELTFTLLEFSAAEDTVTFQLHNPEAKHDEMVGGLIWDNLESVENSNRWRDRLHLPEKPIPVDTFTLPVAYIHGKLHEKFQIGDRVWTVSEIGPDSVTLTPGHDYEAHTLANEVAELPYTREGSALAEGLGEIDRLL
jgi:hypothetical protein